MRTLYLFLIHTVFYNFVTSSPGNPVILVPGDGGSQLEVKLNKTKVPHFLCQKHTNKYSSLWLNIEELLPGVIDCFVDNMRLVYDKKTRTTSSVQGVDIRVPGWGNTSSVEWLDPSPTSHLSPLRYFYDIVNALVKVGYKRGISVRGAPFDFRKAPNELDDYYQMFEKLVEDTYIKNGNKKVVIAAHSYGNPITLYFFNKAPQDWKDKYIHSYVALAGVWGGTVKPLRLFSSGDDLGIMIVKSIQVRPEQRSMPSSAFLMPSDKFWSASEVLVYTDKKNYTVNDYKEFFQDINYMDGYYMRQDTENLIKDVTAPGVPVYCVHGIGLPTPAGLIFGPGEFPDTYPKQINGEGDGTVNLRSLHGCLPWKTQQKQPLIHYTVEGAEHMQMLSNPTIINYLVDVAMNKKN